MPTMTDSSGKTDALRAHVVAAVGQVRRVDDPFRHFLFSDFLDDDSARTLAALPMIAPALNGESGRREFHNETRRFFSGQTLIDFPVCARVADVFQSSAVVTAIAHAVGADLNDTLLRIEICLDEDGFWLEPHTDIGVKALTLQYQLPADGQSDLGTDLYTTDRKWRTRLPFEWNSAYAFVPARNTWHGFERRPINPPRRSIIINYVTHEWRERAQLPFADEPVRML